MARISIAHCRSVHPNTSEFEVRVDSGEVHLGDSFNCHGAFQQSRFRVRGFRKTSDTTTLICDGPVAFADEFAGITLDTRAPYSPPADLPSPADLPTPTPDEESYIEMFDEDWEFRAPLQRAIVLCMHRGDDTYEKIGKRLGVSAQQVRDALRGVSGVFYDSFRKKLGVW
jgi:hypothetical protein